MLVLMVAAGLVLLDQTQPLTVGGPDTVPSGGPSIAPGGVQPGNQSDAATPSPTVLQRGPGTFAIAAGTGPVIGRGGDLHQYRVAVENGVDIAPADFATVVDAALDDPDGWTAGGTDRLQRVGPDTPAEFTIYLATPATAERMCAEGYLEIYEYTNCRVTGKVVINLARWLTAVPGYGAPLDVYREYALNHEVGHQLGQGHELCPGPGRPAPVMQQQTLGLHGCVANPWPYLDGARYEGAPGPA